jgi:ABC-type Fe3+-siderophore transport system permease subunit
MKTPTAIFSRRRLLEKKYLASRVACGVFIIVWISYLTGVESYIASLIAISSILLFFLQFIFQFMWLNWFLGVAMFFVSLYFSLAVWDEFREFETVTREARLLLLVGWGMCFTCVILSIFMIVSCIRDFDK